jgi:hypothetical protein
VLADTIEELVWQAVSKLLRTPQVLIEQYNQLQLARPAETPVQPKTKRQKRGNRERN